MSKENKLSHLEIYQINKEKKKYLNSASICIEALKIVQNFRGWISDDLMKAIAELLCMPVCALEEVATFYSQIYRQPVGRYVIKYCDSVVCYMMGCSNVQNILEKFLRIKIGETTSDKKFTLLPISCLGRCDQAPVMMINKKIYSNLIISNIPFLLEKL